MLHARRTVSPSPVGPLSTAELLNPDPRWVRLEMLRLLSEFGHSLNLVEDLRPAFVILADVLLLNLAASCNIAPQAPDHLPRVGIRVALIPNFHRAVADAMPSEIVANAFADLCAIIMVDAARHLELADLALSVPTLRMTAYVGVLRYLAHDPDLHPRHLLRFHDTVTPSTARWRRSRLYLGRLGCVSRPPWRAPIAVMATTDVSMTNTPSAPCA